MPLRSLWLLLLTLTLAGTAAAQRNAPADAPFILEHSYWIQPGQTGRFVELLERNKMPLLRREIREGRILWMRVTRPRLRSADQSQPDLRLTVAWRNASVAWDDLDPSRFVAELFDDPARQSREEAERERLILRRADVPVQEVVIDRPTAGRE
ncbi:MAG: hypothetical protein M3177_04475 [Pseudomonadota bacterium]|nr:hypothetical protein [Pseudomonadota bacterium]